VPYVKEERREKFRPITDLLYDLIQKDTVSGDLNYLISVLIKEYIAAKGQSYQTFNDISGALKNADSEFYRRIVAPYEDDKIIDNGDVYY
jgi:hypothetical protein